MNLLKYAVFLAFIQLFLYGLSDAQPVEVNRSFGVGALFGSSIAKADINGAKDKPFGRLFARYFPVKSIALESGIGVGTLEAERAPGFFSSLIIPIDVRLLVQPVQQSKLTPYAYAGLGLMYFNPVDKSDRPLLRNAAGEYSHLAPFVPIGFGLQYELSDISAIELTGGYNLGQSSNFDDINSGKNDSYWTLGVNLFAYVSAGNNDWDGDGLLNDEEKEIGTDPFDPDTDGEGLRDGEEVHTYKTNPLKADTDDDGLNDREEIFTYKTNPLNKDTDGDGLIDGDEVLRYKTDPLNPDTDGDGLKDGEEVFTHKTDPLNKDTDGEGLTDGEEVLKYRTDPLKPDTDNDDLTDAEELLTYRTNPLNPDTDSGGMPDGKEIRLALNPLDPKDDVPIINVGERIILEGVNFETAKTTLLPGAKAILDQVVISLAAYPNAEVAIQGHTDNVGGAKYNLKLSIGRAESVKSYLVSKGITASRVATKGFGFTKPIADNSNASGRAKNRRIEFVRLK